MSASSPLIADWISQKLRWGYHYPHESRWTDPIPLTKAATPTAPVYEKIYDQEFSEGSLIEIHATFDSPLCGIRLESGVPLDTGPHMTVNRDVLRGAVAPNVYEYALIPPTSPSGNFSLNLVKEWVWVNWLRIYLFTVDTASDHKCYDYEGTVAILSEDRPLSPRELLESLLEETRKTTFELPPVLEVPAVPAARTLAEEAANVKLKRMVP